MMEILRYHFYYLKYFELARLDWLSNLGISYKKIEENGILFPVIYSEIKYLFPLKFDDLFFVKVGIEELPVSRLKLNYEIETFENKRICFGKVHIIIRYRSKFCPQLPLMIRTR